MKYITWILAFLIGFHGIAFGLGDILIDGSIGLGPTLLSSTDDGGSAWDSQSLNSKIHTYCPFKSSRLSTKFYSEKKLSFTPYRTTVFSMDYSHDPLDIMGRAISYDIYTDFDRFTEQNIYNQFNTQTSRFGGNVRFSPLDNMNLKLNIDLLSRNMDMENNNYSTKALDISGDYAMKNKDMLDYGIRLRNYNHDDKVQDFGETVLMFGWNRPLDIKTDLSIKWDYDRYRYDDRGDAKDFDQHKVSGSWMKHLSMRSANIYGYIEKESYPHIPSIAVSSAYTAFNIGVILKKDLNDNGSTKKNQHDFTHFNYKDSANNDYFNYIWKHSRSKPLKESSDFYYDNRFLVRHFSGDTLQDFYDDQFSAGLTYSNWEKGYLNTGPLVGLRLVDDPKGGSYFSNPKSFMYYGLRADGNFYPEAESELYFAVEYRMFANLETVQGANSKTGNEEVSINADYSRRLAGNWKLIAGVEIGEQINDNGAASTGNNYRNFTVLVEYMFDVALGR